jgi:tripartite-type tricarboxylate transporter receptor subunit TctC
MTSDVRRYVLIVLGVLATFELRADPVADFYRDKTVSITVPGGPGASLAVYCQLVAAHWRQHIPGNPTMVCQHRPGAGGTLGAAYMYNVAPRDGTTVGEIQSASVLAPALREMKFDANQFIWIGSVTPEPAVIAVWHKAPATSLEGAKQTELLMGSTGTSSETYITPILMNKLLGTRFRVVQGYTAGNINLAMERGEVHGRWSPWANWVSVHPDWVRDKFIIPLVQYGPKVPELTHVPYLKDLVATEEGRQMIGFIEIASQVGKGFYLPPGVPAERVSALRAAFMAMMRDEAFLAAAKKINAEIDPVPGEELQRMVNQALATPAPVVAKLRELLGYGK